ncbi:hypothetical protein G4B88_003311 [Cannabis sativa]|uniref:SMP domain-containing protein n=1 Tax=Cannabis sativa TaxID=3483 RepID=A0A7J6FAX3_CANSA|nr:hypothetical protein G4B88_003311 [Cannabis sativa]
MMMRSQVEQPRKPQSDQEPIKYGDVFIVSDELADKPISPAEMMQNSESITLGQAQNESSGFVVNHEYGEPSRATGEAPLSEMSAITIGEALETTAKTIGYKAVDQNDAAAIEAAEARCIGSDSNVVIAGGLTGLAHESCAITIGEALEATAKTLGHKADASAKLPADKRATQKDAEGVVKAELLNNPVPMTKPGGVAACVKTAATLNETIIM